MTTETYRQYQKLKSNLSGKERTVKRDPSHENDASGMPKNKPFVVYEVEIPCVS